jgi:hypothetical protein
MVEFDIKVNPKQRTAYFPRQVVKHLGVNLTLLPNSNAGVIYPKNKNLETVLASLRIIQLDIENQIEVRKRGETK